MLKRKQTKKQDRAAAMPAGAFKNFFWPTISTRRQAASAKQQAASVKHLTKQDYRII